MTVVGFPVLVLALGGCRAVGAVERTRARTLLRLDVDEPAPRRSAAAGRCPGWARNWPAASTGGTPRTA